MKTEWTYKEHRNRQRYITEHFGCTISQGHTMMDALKSTAEIEVENGY